MNACVESVCPGAMVPPTVEPAAKAEAIRDDRPSGWLAWIHGRHAKATMAMPRIVHVHVESFFAAVEQAQEPRLRGKAVLVASGNAVASASAEAMARGVKPGMSVEEARRLNPGAVVLAGRVALYEEYSGRLRAILESHASEVEAAALGSFYLGFSKARWVPSDPEAVLRGLQAEIWGGVGVNVSMGGGSSRSVASVAARLHQPCGLRIVAPGSEREFLAAQPIRELRGIGRRHAEALAAGGIARVGELQRVPKGALVAAFGARVGEKVWEVARGRDGYDWRPLWDRASGGALA